MNIERRGEVQTEIHSTSRIEATWRVPDFFNLPCDLTKGVLSESFEIPGGEAFICMHPYGTHKFQGFTQLRVTVECQENEGIRVPEVDCDLALKAVDGTAYKSLENMDSQFFGVRGSYFCRYFRLSELIGRNKMLLPEGIITVCIQLSSPMKSHVESPALEEEVERHSEPKPRVQEVQITWKIPNFFSLPCNLSEGVVSRLFNVPGGKIFVGLHPYGTLEFPNFTQFVVTLLFPQNMGIRDPEVSCELTLEAVDGSPYRVGSSLDSEVFGGGGYLFRRYFRYSELVGRNKSLVPDGVLTVCINLTIRRQDIDVELDSSSASKSASEESTSDSEEQDSKTVPKSETVVAQSTATNKSVVEEKAIRPQLFIGSEDYDLTMKVQGTDFRTCMSILVARVPAFAKEVQEMVDEAGGRTVDIKPVCSRASTLRAFLNYLYTGMVSNALPTDAAFELFVMADKYKMEDLKRQCAKYSQIQYYKVKPLMA